MDIHYSSGAPGKIAHVFNTIEYANPWIVLDEFEKGVFKSNDRPSVYIPFFSLLESNTAKSFEDITLSLPIDASHITWILTANDISLIPEPLITRCEQFKLDLPTKRQLYRHIIQSIWSDILDDEPWGKQFSPILTSVVRHFIARDLSPREIKRCLTLACGYAAKRNISSTQTPGKAKNITIEISDIKQTLNKTRKKTIGFI